ncbi:energy transducer TonB [Stakelama tenebrarum]|uniref:TonB family protein n=1 Tax=Stakelama tenebrarum TaxID=2711215 RepID=A0A6G6Y340_9SPHN|nr:TonB family protein [Sphingosinithalassobacter tenebrarum]QIG79261.1 TonB family protein [Sphingosinithalassobacter tenebrarum]
MLASFKMAIAAGLLVLGGNTGEQNVPEGARWAAKVSAKLDNAVAFDADRIGPHLHGTTRLSFRIGTDGKATDINVVRSSGNDWLDRRAAGKLRMIGKLPEAPAWIRERTLYADISQGFDDPRYNVRVSGVAMLQ